MNRFAAGMLTLAALLSCRTANAQLPAEPVLNPANGHYYQLVAPTTFTFEQAHTAAQSASHLGIAGHLATITSAEENAFIATTFPSRTGWIGASDAAVEGEWRWITGPETGELFWKLDEILPTFDVVGTSYGFEAWPRRASGEQVEPNDLDVRSPPPNYGSENYAALTTFSTGRGSWNDLAGYWTIGYFIEYSTVPEPSGFALLSLALAFAHGVIRRRCA
jgi:hypothetical protein